MNFKTRITWLWQMLKKHWFKIFAVISIFYAVILPWYLKEHLYLPPKDQLYKEVGVLNPKWLSGRDGYLVGITHNGNTTYYGCRVPGGRRYDCFMHDYSFAFLEAHQGQQAEILWYNERNGVFSTYQRIARLEVNGKEIISLRDTEKYLDNQRGDHVFSFFLLIFAIGMFYIIDKLPDKKEI